MRESDAFQNRPVSMNPKNNLLEIEEHMYIRCGEAERVP